MISLMSLWLPILLSAVIVFVVSSIIHTVLKYHNTDFGKLPDENGVIEALSKFKLPPGDYVMPHAATSEERKAPEFVEKVKKGPVAFITVMPSGMPTMGASLIQWLLYCVVVGIFAAYIGSRSLGPGAAYLEVFRFTGTVAFLSYGFALLQNSIWFKHSWSATIKSVFDALIYGLLTAGTFGWLWPA
jgi:hypothetical protein